MGQARDNATMVGMNNDPSCVCKRYFGKLGRVNHEPANLLFRFSARLARAILKLFARLHFYGEKNIPQTGPVIVVANHLSSLDPLVVGSFLVWSGRWPHFLTRANLFSTPIVGHILRGIEQIPVERGSVTAVYSLSAAQTELEEGRAVVIYPEGTFTYDPDGWPMAGHTGAARLALRTGAPVIPVGQWGANVILPPRHKRKPKLIGRTDVTVRAGKPVDMDDLQHMGEPQAGTIREATVRIMDAITQQLSLVRGQPTPQGRWHPGKRERVARDKAVL